MVSVVEKTLALPPKYGTFLIRLAVHSQLPKLNDY